MKNFITYDLSIRFYKDCQGLRLPRHAKDQFDRASLSICLNLSEGSAKPTLKDRKKFYYIALGSFRESQTILKLFGSEDLIQKADVLGAHLYKLCKS